MHENQMKGCVSEVKVSDCQMNAWTWLQGCDIVQESLANANVKRATAVHV